MMLAATERNGVRVGVFFVFALRLPVLQSPSSGWLSPTTDARTHAARSLLVCVSVAPAFSKTRFGSTVEQSSATRRRGTVP
jgi:hypothetical protein